MQINLTSSTIMSYRDFMRTIQKQLYTSWGKDKIRFTSAYPKVTDPSSISPPLITYSIISKTPGVFGSKNTAELKPRRRETTTVKDSNGKDLSVEMMGQIFDYRISFELWAEDGDAADELAERFQQFMSQYTGYFKKAGVIEILFESMNGESGSTRWNTDLIRREIVYHVRLDEVSSIRCPSVDEIVISSLVHDTSYNMLLNLYLLDQDGNREVLYEDQSILSDDGNQAN